MQYPEDLSATQLRRLAWNKGKLIGAKPLASPEARLGNPHEATSRRPQSRAGDVQPHHR